MSRRRSERSRWVTVFQLHAPVANADGVAAAKAQHEQLHAVVKAFAEVGRVVRLEPAKYGAAVLLKARRA